MKNSQTELSMPPPLTPLHKNCYLNIILTTVLTYNFNVTWNKWFCVTEISILKANAFIVTLLCFKH